MKLVLTITLVLVAALAALYYFSQSKYPAQVMYKDGANLVFETPQEWCFKGNEIDPNTVIVYKTSCFRKNFVSDKAAIISVNALRTSDLDRADFSKMQSCLDEKEPGSAGFREGDAYYCERPAGDDGIRTTVSYRIMDNERIALTKLSVRENEDYASQMGLLKKIVNSYKVVEAK